MSDILLTVILLHFIGNLISCIIALYFFDTNKEFSNSPSQLSWDKKLFIVVKVFKEEENISNTIAYLQELLKPYTNVFVIIAGTVRERNEDGLNLTLEVAKKQIENLQNFEISETLFEEGYQAEQLNYAIRKIAGDKEKIWILTMDIDSKFSPKGLNSIILEINNGARIIQQSALFFQNFQSLPLLQKSHAFYQSRWTISHEFKRYILYDLTNFNISHVVGHGLCINLEELSFFGYFPTETIIEDINLGFYIISFGRKIKVVNVLEDADNPFTFKDGLRQEYLWSFGAMLYPKYWLFFLKKFSNAGFINKIRAFWCMLQGVLFYFIWLTSSWILLYIIIMKINTFLGCSILGIYILESYLCGLLFMRSKAIDIYSFVLSPIYLIIGGIRRSFPADFAFIKTILGIEKFKKTKTIH